MKLCLYLERNSMTSRKGATHKDGGVDPVRAAAARAQAGSARKIAPPGRTVSDKQVETTNRVPAATFGEDECD